MRGHREDARPAWRGAESPGRPAPVAVPPVGCRSARPRRSSP